MFVSLVGISSDRRGESGGERGREGEREGGDGASLRNVSGDVSGVV